MLPADWWNCDRETFQARLVQRFRCTPPVPPETPVIVITEADVIARQLAREQQQLTVPYFGRYRAKHKQRPFTIGKGGA